jgi:hypothetical protein
MISTFPEIFLAFEFPVSKAIEFYFLFDLSGS